MSKITAFRAWTFTLFCNTLPLHADLGGAPTSLKPPLPTLGPTLNAGPALPAIRGIRQYHRAEIEPRVLAGRLKGFDAGPIRLDLGGSHRWDLELERTSIRSPGYMVRLLTSKGVETVAPVPDQSFRGHVRGKPGSKVRLSFQDGRVNGYIDPGEGPDGRVFMEPMDHFQAGMPSGSHAVYFEKDVIPEAGVTCGTASAPGGSQGSPVFPGASGFPGGIRTPAPTSPGSLIQDQEITAPRPLAKAAAEPCALAEIAVAVEYSMVKGLGTAAAVEKRINDIYNMVDGLYQDPLVNIHVRISEVFIEMEPKATWGSSVDINSYLNAMGPWMTGPNGFKKSFDVGTLWYYSIGGGTVGLAWVGVVCQNNRSNVIRYFTATSRSMMIDAAHELGHNFSANHISNENWIMNPSITGYNDKWDATTIGSIVNHKKSRSCLSACNVAPIANFTVQGPSACAETRTFTDLSLGDPTSWLWEFGDGTSSREKSPVHTYQTPGKYAARLSASNAFGATDMTQGNIRVRDIPTPSAMGADGCPPSALTLEAQGTGTLRWYDTAAGGAVIAEGSTFTTPILSKAKTYYVEDGEADLPIGKLGPVSTAIGAGQNFIANGDRRLFFDVHRSATLISAKVRAGSAGPRMVEILDARDKRVAVKTVQVPAGESRVNLGFNLDPGQDYAIKVVGGGDSANLFRNSTGADYPYLSKDTLITITGSDATAADSVTQSGYYYFFYDWEIRETGCTSARVPVAAKFTCTSNLLDLAAAAFSADLRPVAPGRYRLEGMAPAQGNLEVTFRSLDGGLIARKSQSVSAGPLSLALDLEPASTRLMLVEIKLGKQTLRKILPNL